MSPPHAGCFEPHKVRRRYFYRLHLVYRLFLPKLVVYRMFLISLFDRCHAIDLSFLDFARHSRLQVSPMLPQSFKHSFRIVYFYERIFFSGDAYHIDASLPHFHNKAASTKKKEKLRLPFTTL